jgi:hypothetical protein
VGRLRAGDPMGPVFDAAAFLFQELNRLHVLQSEFFVYDQHWIADHKLEPDPGIRAQTRSLPAIVALWTAGTAPSCRMAVHGVRTVGLAVANHSA